MQALKDSKATSLWSCRYKEINFMHNLLKQLSCHY